MVFVGFIDRIYHIEFEIEQLMRDILRNMNSEHKEDLLRLWTHFYNQKNKINEFIEQAE